MGVECGAGVGDPGAGTGRSRRAAGARGRGIYWAGKGRRRLAGERHQRRESVGGEEGANLKGFLSARRVTRGPCRTRPRTSRLGLSRARPFRPAALPDPSTTVRPTIDGGDEWGRQAGEVTVARSPVTTPTAPRSSGWAPNPR